MRTSMVGSEVDECGGAAALGCWDLLQVKVPDRVRNGGVKRRVLVRRLGRRGRR